MERFKSILPIGVFFVVIAVAVYFFAQQEKVKTVKEQKKAESKIQQNKEKMPNSWETSAGFATLWMTDFNNNRVLAFNPAGEVVWEQNMSTSPIPESSWYFIGGIEYVTLAPNGNLIVTHGDGMMVQELDRKSKNLVWQYGKAGLQSYRGGSLDEPDKSYKINDHEVVINDGNDRKVVVVDQNTNEVVWQYGEHRKMGSTEGLLRGNTSVRPIDDGQQFLITDTIEKKVILVDRTTKKIVWEYAKPDAKWLQHVFPTSEGTYVLEDRQKGEVFEIDKDGKMKWYLDKFADGSSISYPTDTVKLDTGNVLIAEAGKRRIVEVIPENGTIVREYKIHGFVSTIAVDQDALDGAAVTQTSKETSVKNPITVSVKDELKRDSESKPTVVGSDKIRGKVDDVNASTGKAGQFSLKVNGVIITVQSNNYTSILNSAGNATSLMSINEGDIVTVIGKRTGGYVSADEIQNLSR